MNKTLSKKLEEAARKYSKKSTLGLKDSYIKGGEFINKRSDKQYTQKDMYHLLYEGVYHFLSNQGKPIAQADIKTYFKNYIKK